MRFFVQGDFKKYRKLILFSTLFTLLIWIILFYALYNSPDSTVTVMKSTHTVDNKVTVSYKYFKGEETYPIEVTGPGKLLIDVTSEVKKGDLTLKIVNSQGNTVATFKTNESEILAIPVNLETYTFMAIGDETEGGYSFEYFSL